MNRLIIYISLATLLCIPHALMGRNKKNKSLPKKEIKGFENHLKSSIASDSTGLMIMHRSKDKVWVEFPTRLLGKEMLFVSSIIDISDNGEGVVGQFTTPETMFRFVRNDKKIEARIISNQPLLNLDDNLDSSFLHQSATGGVYKSFKIEAFAKDSSSVLVNMTPLFLEHSDFSNPFSSYAANSMYGMVTRKYDYDSTRSFIKDIRGYINNLSVTCVMGYDVDYTAFGSFPMQQDVPVTVTASRMLMLLPEDPMRIRYANKKVNTMFFKRKQYVNQNAPLNEIYLVKRWRLEPSDQEAWDRGEKVKPIKPIVFYIDTLLPKSWQPYIKEGVEEWNKCFERIGYTEAVQVKEWPKDKKFSSSNILYSTINYAPDWMYMAQTSMHTDPRTGEILNASLYIHHNFLSLQYSNRCTQTMASDPTVRKRNLTEKQIGEMLKVAITQQIGRCLGLTDNMGASFHYPVDSLRSANFTQKYGLTPSVMDNLMCNYIAQPEDVRKGTLLVQPGIGKFDYFPIKYLYAYIPTSKPEDEQSVLDQWVKTAYEQKNYHFGPRQEFYALYDPTSVYWDLGDNPLKSADYQIKNLQNSFEHFMNWYSEEDYDFTRRTELYASLMKLLTNRAMELSFWIGGIPVPENCQNKFVS